MEYAEFLQINVKGHYFFTELLLIKVISWNVFLQLFLFSINYFSCLCCPVSTLLRLVAAIDIQNELFIMK